MARVLLIDDDPDILLFSSKVLENAGHKIFKAKDADQAFDILQREELDLVISDANMPQISGFEVVKHVKSFKKFKHIPIALLTSRREKTDVEKAIQLGVSDYIVKPISPKTLTEKVTKLISTPLKINQIEFNSGFVPLAEASLKLRILTLSSDGATLSGGALEIGETLKLGSSIFSQIQLDDIQVTVDSCVETNGKYISTVSFNKLSRKSQAKLDDWIKARLKENKQGAA